jgi:hypothetical protein
MRTKVMGRFPGEDSCLSLVWAVLDLLITHETNGIRFNPARPLTTQADQVFLVPGRPGRVFGPDVHLRHRACSCCSHRRSAARGTSPNSTARDDVVMDYDWVRVWQRWMAIASSADLEGATSADGPVRTGRGSG